MTDVPGLVKRLLQFAESQEDQAIRHNDTLVGEEHLNRARLLRLAALTITELDNLHSDRAVVS